jgi:hypothetical protein
MTQVRGGGGGFHGGGFHGGGGGFHGFGGGGFHGGGIHYGHVFHGGGFRYGGYHRYGGFRFAHHHRHLFDGGYYPYYMGIITPITAAGSSGPITVGAASAITGITGITTEGPGQGRSEKGTRSGALFRFRFSFSLHPVLELPGLERQFPRRQVFQPPLLEAARRPVAEAPFFPGRGFDDARHDAAAFLLRRLGDDVDEIGLVGHDSLPSRNAAPQTMSVLPVV